MDGRGQDRDLAFGLGQGGVGVDMGADDLHAFGKPWTVKPDIERRRNPASAGTQPVDDTLLGSVRLIGADPRESVLGHVALLMGHDAGKIGLSRVPGQSSLLPGR